MAISRYQQCLSTHKYSLPIKIFRFQFFCCLILTLHDPVFSQTKYLRDNFWIENYTKKDGLPEDIVTGITQDKKGFLWITTPLKLIRFDGYHFELFDPQKDFPELHYHFSNNILED